MRVVVPAIAVALLVLGVCGCTVGGINVSSDSTEGAFTSFEDAIEALPGVDDATLGTTPNGTQVHLTVELELDATTREIEAVGLEASKLRGADMPAGLYPGPIELRLGMSTYAYFSLPTDKALREQVSYWAELARSGVEAVTVRTFTAPVDAPPSNAPMPTTSAAGAPVLLNAPTGRFVGVMLSVDSASAAFDVLERVRAIPDPGASVGEWHLISTDASVKAEFAGPDAPSASDVQAVESLAAAIGRLGDDATLGLRVDSTGDARRITAELTAFDDDIGDESASTIEATLPGTAIWAATLELVSTLESTGATFTIKLLSNALADSGNFVLQVGADQCDFTGDDVWPSLSDELLEHWAAVRAANGHAVCAA